MKRSLLTGSLMMALCVFLGCSTQFGERYTHYDLGVSMCVPGSWEETELDVAQDKTMMAFEDGKGATVLIMKCPAEDREEWFEKIKEASAPILESNTLVLSKYKTRWIMYNDRGKTHLVYVLQDRQGRVFSIMCTAERTEFSSYRNLFDKIARSFKEGR